MIAGQFFITPHAVNAFRERIADMPYEDALAKIIRGLQHAQSVAPTKNGKGLCIRVRGKWNFRAVVIGQQEGRPAVVTILRSGK